MEDITVTLIDKAWQAVNDDAAMLEMSRTNVINRAVQVHHDIVGELRAGATLILRRRDGTYWKYDSDELLCLAAKEEA